MSKPYLITFGTEGPPHDKGFALGACAEDIKVVLNPYFEEIFSFTPRSLKELPGSEPFCNEWPDPLAMNPNAHTVGYFDFKSLLISYAMDNLPEDAVIMYHDGNFEKNPQYWETNWENIEAILNALTINSDIFMQFEQSDVKVRHHVKRYVLEQVIPDPIQRAIVEDCMLINAARIVVRNTPYARDFIREYRELCLKKDLVARFPDFNPRPDFKWSCGDQDVLNALVYRHILDKRLPPDFPGITFLYRVIRFENRPFTWRFKGPKEAWHDKPHPTGFQRVLNNELIDYMRNK